MARMGYQATRDAQGVMTIHHVPIFAENTRGDLVFDGDWIEKACRYSLQAAEEGYHPPLHIRHHEPVHELNDAIKPAGFLKITHAGVITFKGSPKHALFADLVITSEWVQEDILCQRLPYRSVEVPKDGTPKIVSLALLDHEAPYLELPMLVVSNLDDRKQPAEPITAYAAVKNPYRCKQPAPDGPAVACFSFGDSAHLIFQEADMPKEEKKGKEKPKEDETENMEADGGLDVSAVVKAIKDGSISVADMDAIMAAIEEQKSTATSEETPEDEAAPAAMPGVESMKDNSDKELLKTVAHLKGENEALKGRLDEMDAEAKRKADVAEALKLLEGRPLGADVEEKLVAFHTKHGAEAFQDYVASMTKTFAQVPRNGDTALANFASHTAGVPSIAMKYQTHGTEAVGFAAGFAAQWDQLKARGHVRVDKKRYVDLHMRREHGIALEEED